MTEPADDATALELGGLDIARNRRIFAIVGGLLVLLFVVVGLVLLLNLAGAKDAHGQPARSVPVVTSIRGVDGS